MEDLIGRWIAGDPKAGEEIYKRYFPRVRGFAAHIGERLVDADDIAQDALIAGLNGLKAGKRPDRLTHWLMGIARHVALRKRRANTPCASDASPSSESGARTLAARREMSDLLERTLGELSENDREVVNLRHRDGMARKEIAERLEMPVETVHARCERAYARLRKALERHFTTLARRRVPERGPVTLAEIAALRPAFRDAVTARHLDGLSESAAAAKLGIPVATLRARLQSALELLKCGADADFNAVRAERRRGT